MPTSIPEYSTKLRERIIQWKDVDSWTTMIIEKVRQQSGRVMFLVHAGGSYLGRIQDGTILSTNQAHKYIAQLCKAIAAEAGCIVMLEPDLQLIGDTTTNACAVCIPTYKGFPIPCITTDGSRNTWTELIHKMNLWGIITLSPFGGEIAEVCNGKVQPYSGCVSSALRQMIGQYSVYVCPQICGSDEGNIHIDETKPLEYGAYLATTESFKRESYC